MYDETIQLIKHSTTVDRYGDTIKTEDRREVFAELKSIGQSEFYQAAAVGYKPEIKFVLADYLEYKHEDSVAYTEFGQDEEIIYDIVRTYRNGNELELVCQKGAID